MKKIMLIASAAVFILTACIEGDPLHDVSGNYLKSGIVRDTLYAIADTSFVEGKISTAFGNKLLLGTYAGYQSRFLLRFGSLPADTIVIDSLRLMLTSVSSQGETILPLSGHVYRVLNDWDESVNNDESWDFRNNIDYDPAYTAEFEISADTANTVHLINLPPALMDVWRDTTGGNKNHGLLLDYNNASYINEFSSVDGAISTKRPRLIAIYYNAVQDSVYHDTLFVNKDASLIEFTGSIDSDQLLIGSGYSIRSFFNFDLDPIPTNAVMATMHFILHRDSIRSVFNDNKAEEMSLRTVRSEYDLLPTYDVDSTYTQNIFYSVTLTEETKNTLDVRSIERGNVSQNFFQDIINEEIPFGSFLVHYKAEGDDISVYAVRDRNDPDVEKRPQLIVEYYIVPDPRL